MKRGGGKTGRQPPSGLAESEKLSGQGNLLDQFVVLPTSSSTRPIPAPPSAKAQKSAKRSDGPDGHRARLRERFRTGGPDAVADYELLEMMLFAAFRQGDTKPLAKRLIARFGSFAEAMQAPDHLLLEVEGIGERAIDEMRLVRAAALRLMKRNLEPTKTKDKSVLSSWQAVLDYLHAAQGFEQKEAFRILFLDKRNNLIADEVQQRGTVDHTPVYVREVMARALELAATSIILVHNHPSGDPSPSRADIDMTKVIIEAGRPLNIAVHDHIIVGRQGHVSMKAMRLI